jgi:hypothetical protein
LAIGFSHQVVGLMVKHISTNNRLKCSLQVSVVCINDDKALFAEQPIHIMADGVAEKIVFLIGFLEYLNVSRQLLHDIK